jgi:hypothetical protein
LTEICHGGNSIIGPDKEAFHSAGGWGMNAESASIHRIICVYCDYRFTRVLTDSECAEQRKAHTVVCPEHPMRELERRASALAAAVQNDLNVRFANGSVQARNDATIRVDNAATALRELMEAPNAK